MIVVLAVVGFIKSRFLTNDEVIIVLNSSNTTAVLYVTANGNFAAYH